MANFIDRLFRGRAIRKEPLVFEVEEEEEITDEIEKSLWLIKEELDLPTEEIEASIATRRLSSRSRNKRK